MVVKNRNAGLGRPAFSEETRLIEMAPNSAAPTFCIMIGLCQMLVGPCLIMILNTFCFVMQ
jgi:hypothetical protein